MVIVTQERRYSSWTRSAPTLFQFLLCFCHGTDQRSANYGWPGLPRAKPGHVHSFIFQYLLLHHAGRGTTAETVWPPTLNIFTIWPFPTSLHPPGMALQGSWAGNPNFLLHGRYANSNKMCLSSLYDM